MARLGIADPARSPRCCRRSPRAGGRADRHRVHRALRDLLERLAAARPLVLCLDDVHWADPASAGALAALVRRPPAGRSCSRSLPARADARAGGGGARGRAGRGPRRARAARAARGGRAVALVGEAGREVHRLAGGNPFYLEQLARVRGAGVRATVRCPSERAARPDRPPATARRRRSPGEAPAIPAGRGGDRRPPSWRATRLAPAPSHLASKADPAPRRSPPPAGGVARRRARRAAARRALLEGAAIAGDPFGLDLAAAVAELDEPAAPAALDALLAAFVVAARDREDLLASLDVIAAGGEAAAVATGLARSKRKPVFLFAGQGTQWAGMGVELIESHPHFAAGMRACEEAFSPYLDWSLEEVLRDSDRGWIEHLEMLQPALFAVMVSLGARLWRSMGVHPAAVARLLAGRDRRRPRLRCAVAGGRGADSRAALADAGEARWSGAARFGWVGLV